MRPRSGVVAVLALGLGLASGSPAMAQWGYPGGFGDWGWGGWGAVTPQGDMARGLGVFAAGAGVYNKQTAIADSINADTILRWNEYMFQSQQLRNRRFHERRARELGANAEARKAIQDRIRNNPEPQDIFRGDALNSVLDEVNNPKVHAKALSAALVKVGGDRIRAIPFRYAAAGITMGLHQVATGDVPAPLRAPEFADDLATLKALDEQLVGQVDAEQEPDPETVKKFLAAIHAIEEKAATALPAGLASRQASRYLKALHGLAAMLKAPALDSYLSGLDKTPDATLGELLRFMSAFNLRFGPATTPQQREVYSFLYPKLVELRNQVSPEPPAEAASPEGDRAQDFFGAMSQEDLNKKAPKP